MSRMWLQRGRAPCQRPQLKRHIASLSFRRSVLSCSIRHEGPPRRPSASIRLICFSNCSNAYSFPTHQAVRDNLIRLNAAHLRIRVKRVDIPMPRLMEVVVDDGYQGRNTPGRQLKGSDLIRFSVLESKRDDVPDNVRGGV